MYTFRLSSLLYFLKIKLFAVHSFAPGSFCSTFFLWNPFIVSHVVVDNTFRCRIFTLGLLKVIMQLNFIFHYKSHVYNNVPKYKSSSVPFSEAVFRTKGFFLGHKMAALVTVLCSLLLWVNTEALSSVERKGFIWLSLPGHSLLLRAVRGEIQVKPEAETV